MKKTKGCRLLLIPLPLQGHINPMLQLAQILYSNGFSITIIHTSFNSLNPSNYPHFNFCCIQEGLSESSASNILNLVVELNTSCVKPFKECLGKLLCDVSEEPVACLISDAMCYFTQDVATSFQLPRLVLRTGGASSFVAFAAFPFLKERGYLPIQDSKLEDAVKELPPLRVKDLPMINTKEPEKYYELICNFVNKTKASLGVIWNTFEDLESLPLSTLSQQFSIPMFPIGPFHKYFPTNNTSSSSLIPQDQNCMSWLNKHKPKSVVYMSFGSVASITEAEFLEIAWGLVNSNYPFLWVVRLGLVCGHEWLGPLPNGFMENLEGRGYIVKWAPQQEILAHQAVGLFWTHNGWNSTLESVCEGVPMICMPCFTDQKVNARYVSHVWRVGLQLENGMERGEIERTIRKVMEDDDVEGNEIRDRALKLKEEAEVCLEKGGSSCSALERLVVHILSLVSFTFEAS